MEQYIQSFVLVCESVFKALLGLDIVAERPFFADKNEVNDYDVSGVIGLTGEAKGAVVLSMNQNLARRLTALLTGSDHADFDDDVIDAIGEIINIIAGNVKRDLEESFRLYISLPTIVSGANHQIRWPNEQSRIIRIPFRLFEAESFVLSIAIDASPGD